MQWNKIKGYIIYNYKTFIIELMILFALACSDQKNIYYLASFLALGLVVGYYRYQAYLQKIARLKIKGLTEEDIRNIAFVKKWENTRHTGILRYCLLDGGIICGSYMWLVISLLCALSSFVEFRQIADTPANMFAFIGYTYVIGATLGVILFRIRWPRQERKFKKLTDPIDHELVLRDFY